MTIHLQDRNLIVSYIQTYLKEYSGLSLVENSEGYYEISQSRPLKVTGIYNEQTYKAVSIFMAFNFPKEQFPVRYDIDRDAEVSVIRTPFDQDKLRTTMEYLYSKGAGKGEVYFTEEMYNNIISQSSFPEKYFDYQTLVKFFDGEDGLYESLVSNLTGTFSRSDMNQSLIVFISHNLVQSQQDSEVCDIGSRILSYFLDEVVTPSSEMDEIYRVQQIIYPAGIDYRRAGIFDKEMTDYVTESQEKFLEDYTIDKGTSKEVHLPEGYEDFKVTGYVDPWTELILKGGVD